MSNKKAMTSMTWGDCAQWCYMWTKTTGFELFPPTTLDGRLRGETALPSNNNCGTSKTTSYSPHLASCL